MDSGSKSMRLYARLSAAVMAKVIVAGLGYWVGDKIDMRLGTKPLFAVCLLTIGLGLGIWWIVWIADKEATRG
jgi:F0F1-type ATP synthase assembly protein I